MNWDLEIIFWLVSMVIFIIAETATVSLVSIWFAAGSLLALVVALAGGSLAAQVIVFLAAAVVLLASLRPLVRKYLNPRLVRTNVDGIVGSTGIVTVSVNNIAALGQVKIGGMEWSARSTSGSPLMEGTTVRVDRIEGVKVFVSPVEVSAPV